MSVLSNPYVLGYHGCRKSVEEAILRGEKPHLHLSDNTWDWLGKGIYFWEADPVRGFEWAQEHCKGTGEDPFVIGAVIHLGNCLNLMDRDSLETLRDIYDSFKQFHEAEFPDQPLPTNRDTKRGSNHELDCKVINHLHWTIDQSQGLPNPPQPFNTVRGLYQEANEVFPGSRIKAKTHIQIAVLTPEESIQGYFRVPESHYLNK
jgi:hypothetical protein